MYTSFIFPAFVSEYSGKEPEILRMHSGNFGNLLVSASEYLGVDLTTFDINTNNFTDHELNTQYISYIFSCAVSNILKQRNIVPEYVAGYSMGLYGALYCGEALNFFQGLSLIRKAHEFIREATRHGDYTMGSVIGLSKQDILELLSVHDKIGLVNTNGDHAFMVAGIREEVANLLEHARQEGALHVSFMRVSSPYHTKMLTGAAQKLRAFIEQEIDVRDSTIKIVSGIDQQVFRQKHEIVTEITRNLNTQINWLETMKKLLELKTSRFIECGAGTSLFKTAKFIKGDFRIYSLEKISELLG